MRTPISVPPPCARHPERGHPSLRRTTVALCQLSEYLAFVTPPSSAGGVVPVISANAINETMLFMSVLLPEKGALAERCHPEPGQVTRVGERYNLNCFT